MKAAFSTLFFNLVFVAVMYAAFWLNINGAQNLVMFMMFVFYLPLALIVWGFSAVIIFNYDKVVEKGKPVTDLSKSWQRILNWVISWITLVILVWNGYIGTAIVWVFYMASVWTLRYVAKDLQEKITAHKERKERMEKAWSPTA